MNVTSKFAIPPQLPPTQERTAPAKPAPTASAQAPVTPKASRQDSFQTATPAPRPPADASFDAQVKQGGWSQFTPVFRQSQQDNCGPAVAAMLVSSLGQAGDKTPEQLMNGFEAQYTNGAGTTPEQMGQMLAGQGVEVTRGAAKLDRDALDAALRAGHKVVALVDSNLISPKHPQAPGSAHWVVIDGMDGKNSYRIKDPGRGTGYWIQLPRLTHAMNSGWSSYGGGGMLVVRATNQNASEQALAQENSKHSGTLGDEPGIGSNSASLGRESAS